MVAFPGVELRLTAEHALRAAIDTHVFAGLRDLESFPGGRAVQAVYVSLVRRLPNVMPGRELIGSDSGFSESSVKRAIKLLEQCRLIKVERRKGKSSAYTLIDLRDRESAGLCLRAIRSLIRNGTRSMSAASRFTCDPTVHLSRVTSEPSGRVTSDRRVGSEVAREVAKKNQFKQQAAAAYEGRAGDENEGDTGLAALARWGLSSAAYLLEPGHPKAIPELVSSPEQAGNLVELAMASTSWSQNAGIGARVAHLRTHITEALRTLEARSNESARARAALEKRAEAVIETLPEYTDPRVRELERTRRLALLKRGLKRLGEPRNIVLLIAKNRDACRRIISAELLHEDLEETLDAASERGFSALRERLFRKNPALQRFYQQAGRESLGLRLHLLQLMRDETLHEGDTVAPVKAVNDAQAPDAEVRREPSVQPVDTPGGPAACRDRQRSNSRHGRANASRRRWRCRDGSRTRSPQGA